MSATKSNIKRNDSFLCSNLLSFSISILFFCFLIFQTFIYNGLTTENNKCSLEKTASREASIFYSKKITIPRWKSKRVHSLPTMSETTSNKLQICKKKKKCRKLLSFVSKWRANNSKTFLNTTNICNLQLLQHAKLMQRKCMRK